MVDRVRRPNQFDILLSDLVKEHKVFDTYKDALVFAASLGFKRDHRVEFDKSSEPVHLSVFSGQFDQMVMNVLAIGESEDPLVMAKDRDEEKIKIFEEYACGGLEIIQNQVAKGYTRFDQAILDLVTMEQDNGSILDEISNLAKA